MGSYDGAEVCELVGLHILHTISTKIDKNDTGLYRDDGLIILRNSNGRTTDQKRKRIIQIFKDIGFQIEIETNLKKVNFLDVTLNLTNNTYKPFKKPNDQLRYVHTSSNHPPQILKQLPASINDRLSNNSSNENIFNTTKQVYEDALKKSGYKNTKLQYKEKTQPKARTRKRNITWFNPPYNKNISTNIGKHFLSLINKHFPRTNKLHKIFNRNNIKVSYSCTENIARIIKSHNKKLTTPKETNDLPCNCRNKKQLPPKRSLQIHKRHLQMHSQNAKQTRQIIHWPN